ncbi:hypothetical protein JCM10449v2_000514 [Rhodotorula kratochvilovae]
MAPVSGSSGGTTPLTKLTDVANRWSAWVTIDNKPVQVYQVEHKDQKTTCYIEAAEGKEFKVCFTRASRAASDLAAYLKIDGTSIEGFSLPQKDLPGQVDTFEGARISQTAIRPFKFAPIALTDDPDEADNSEAVVKNLGSIQIETYRTRILGKAAGPSHAYQDAKQHVVDEKSKKATMSHSTAYGEAQTSVASQQSDSVIWVDPYGTPGYTLEFKYRSRALLELEDIVKPRLAASPPPARAASAAASASGSGSPVDSRKKRKTSALSLSDNEDEDLRAKIARLESENSKLKGGVKREKGDVKPKVKGEPIGKVRKENGRTVIDLLDEDDD